MPKPVQVTYSRTISDGNFGNRKFEVVMDLEEGDTAEEAMDAAKAFIAMQVDEIPQEPVEIHPF